MIFPFPEPVILILYQHLFIKTNRLTVALAVVLHLASSCKQIINSDTLDESKVVMNDSLSELAVVLSMPIYPKSKITFSINLIIS